MKDFTKNIKTKLGISMSINLTGKTSEKGADEATKTFSRLVGLGVFVLLACIGISLVIWTVRG